MDKNGAMKSPPIRAAATVKDARSTSDSVATRPARFGLAAKLFAILLFIGAGAVLITSVLGYIRARDALEETIYKQLTAARQTKASQVESYFRTISNEMRLLASSKMVVDATREVSFDVQRTRRERDAGRAAPEGRGLVRPKFPAGGAPVAR